MGAKSASIKTWQWIHQLLMGDKRVWIKIWPWIRLLLVVVVPVIAAKAYWFVEMLWKSVVNPNGDLRQSIIVAVAALLAALATVTVGAITRQGVNKQLNQQREYADKQTDLETVRDLRKRFTVASEQLAHDSSVIRLAGVYAMTALADDWVARAKEHEVGEIQTCIDVLCAYQRTRKEATLGALSTDESVAEAAREAEQQVRETITRVITQHLQEDASASWQGRDFDFTGAIFEGRHTFSGATFAGGRASFDDATFAGGRVSFERAKFAEGGRVSFERAKFAEGQVSFYGATFAGGQVSFTGATFAGGLVWFTGATFAGGWVSFYDATFAGGWVSFYGATFAGGRVSFDVARFAGGRVSFERATFAGRLVSFDDAIFAGGHVLFGPGPDRPKGPWGDTQPEQWPLAPTS